MLTVSGNNSLWSFNVEFWKSPWCAPKWRRLGPTIVDDNDTCIVAIPSSLRSNLVKVVVLLFNAKTATQERQHSLDAPPHSLYLCLLKLRCAIGKPF
jgi:hypothetical protein